MMRSVRVAIAVGLLLSVDSSGWIPVAEAQAREIDLAAIAVAEDADCAFLATPLTDPRPELGPIRCGVLDVPENWRQTEGRRLQLRWVVLESEAAAATADPLVYLGGGPGEQVLRGIAVYAATFAPFRAERDVVLFDQRGTGLSSPLRCASWTIDDLFAVDAQVFLGDEPAEEAVPAEEGVAAVADGAAPLPPAAEAIADELLAAARLAVADGLVPCAQQILAAGVDLRQYNSIANASDTVALVRALGYEAYNLYGISYGTRLALAVMRDHPKSGLRAVVLDSTFPPEIRGFEAFPAEAHEVVGNLFADCAADPACAAAYPDLTGRTRVLLARLAAEPIAVAPDVAIEQGDLLQVLGTLSGNIEAVPYVPRLIAEMERGEAETFLALVTGEIGGPPVDEGSGSGSGSASPAEATPTADEADDALVEALSALLPGFAGDVAALSPPDLFLADLQLRAAALPRDEAANLLVRLALLGNVFPDRANLRAFVERSYPAPEEAVDRSVLLALIDQMSEAEVRDLFNLVQGVTDLADPTRLGMNNLMFLSFECNEETPFERFERSVRTAQGLEIPELGAQT